MPVGQVIDCLDAGITTFFSVVQSSRNNKSGGRVILQEKKHWFFLQDVEETLAKEYLTILYIEIDNSFIHSEIRYIMF